MMLVDVVMGLSLSILFIFVITQFIDSTEQIFKQAKIKNYLMNVFVLNMSYFDSIDENQSQKIVISQSDPGYDLHIGDVVIEANSYPWNNDLQEVFFDIYLSAGGLHQYFPVLRKTYANHKTINKISNDICSADIGSNNIVGDFSYINDIFNRNIMLDVKFQVSSSTMIVLPTNPLLPPTDFEIHDDKAIVSIDSNVSSDPDILLFDISTKDNPKLKSSINTGPGITSFFTSRNYIYAAAASTASQLHIINIKSDLSFSLISKYQLPLPYATATPPFGTAIIADSDKVYLGTSKWDGEEFNIINIQDPMHPNVMGTYEIGSKVENIMIRDNLAYIANAGQEQLLILDISDPSNIHKISSFSPSGYSRQEGKTLSYFNGQTYFGRTSGGFDIDSDHELFSLPKYNSMNFSGGIYGLVPYRTHILAITRRGGSEIAILRNDFSSTTLANISLPILPQAVFCKDKNVYILSHNTPVIYSLRFDINKNVK